MESMEIGVNKPRRANQWNTVCNCKASIKCIFWNKHICYRESERVLTRQERGKMLTRWRAGCYCGVAGPSVLGTIWPARLAMVWRRREGKSLAHHPESRQQRPSDCCLCSAPGSWGSEKLKPIFPLYTTRSFPIYIVRAFPKACF